MTRAGGGAVRRAARGLACVLALIVACGTASAAPAALRPSTAGPRVQVLAPPLRLPANAMTGTLRVYLPPGYANGDARYPVLYMFDGQNLFDDATSYVGEWGVDEAMDALAREEGFEAIVVAIDHGGERRVRELIPHWSWRFPQAEGAAFVDAVVHAVKPFVDATYRTRPAREDTAILGSSLGGLSADYALHRYPQVFSKAGVFSPSYWVSAMPFQNAEATPLPLDARVALTMGGREGDEAVADVQRMAAVLQRHHPGGVSLRIDADAEHNEAAWRAQFPATVRWLFALPAAPTPARAP